MAEEADGQDTGAEASGAGVDPAAVALALHAAHSDPSIAEDARAFLRNQNSLIDIQKHHLHEQFKNLRLNIWEKRMGLLLRIATGFVGLIIAAGLTYMIWDASQSSGLLIEPFSVPPDLVSRGLTGQVLASQILDNLIAMQNDTATTRPNRSYTNDWDKSGIKLDIPETGVSLTELDDFLREKLGHDVHITGEIIRTGSGVSLTARVGGNGSETVNGSETDLNGLVQKSAEAIYRITNPNGYGSYLAEHDRLAEAISVAKSIADTGSRSERAYAFAAWGMLSGEQEGIDVSSRLLQQAMATEPDNVNAQRYLADLAEQKSLPEQTIRESKKTMSLAASDQLRLNPSNYAGDLNNQGFIDEQLGDLHGSAQLDRDFIQKAPTRAPLPSATSRLAQLDASDHDLAAARAAILNVPNYTLNLTPGFTALAVLRARILIDSELQDWTGVLSETDAFASTFQKYPGLPSYLPTMTVPLTAYAEAKLGKTADAEKHIAATPADCYECLIARAKIAEAEGQTGRADYWFAHAIDGQKSIPFAYYYWGEALLDRGDADGAITKFTIANQKGPKFADQLECWGEALIAKKQPDLALAKFTEAQKYAPNWGRLHLKWGEALGYAGQKDEAQKQYALAAGLDLSSADKAELAKVRG